LGDKVTVEINVNEYDRSRLLSMIRSKVLSEVLSEFKNLTHKEREDIVEYIVNLWDKYYISTGVIDKAVEKIIDACVPKEFNAFISLTITDKRGYLILDKKDMPDPNYVEVIIRIDKTYSAQEVFMGSYVYNMKANMFEILDELPTFGDVMFDPFDYGFGDYKEETIRNIMGKLYAFNNRLLGLSSKKIHVYSAQPEKRVGTWREQGYIPEGVYFTNRLARAEYYWEEGDVIIDLYIPEDKLLCTHSGALVKEYVLLEEIPFGR